MFASLLIVVGLVALVFGAELLVRGASQLASAVGVSSLVVGLTVVAFGTSAPEMAVSVTSSLAGNSDMTMGNVTGSNIFNVLLILGLSALITPLVVDQKLVRFDVPLILIISIVVWVFAYDLVISRWEGAILFSGIMGYTVRCILVGRKESSLVEQEYDDAYNPPESNAANVAKVNPIRFFLWQSILIIGGLILLVAGANLLVSGSSTLARAFGVSDLVIGLTIVAGGTSLPELATSIVAAIRGERDIAVGNVVGSNIFNLLGVLGLSATLLPDGVSVAEQAWKFDLPVMIAVAGACMPVFFTGHRISRGEGLLFVAYYVAYIVALILLASGSPALPAFEVIMIGFAAPLTIITLFVTVSRSIEMWRWQEARTQFSRENHLPRIIVIGGGFGGVAVTKGLGNTKSRVTLIDRRNFHLFQPLLYQVATGSLSPANIAAPLRNLLRSYWNVAVRMDDVVNIDLSQKLVHLAHGDELPYDYLIVAAGVRHSYFGHREWEVYAPGLKSVEDATEIRRRILTAFEAAETETDDLRRRRLLTFVIVGAGPTGVELAGSLGEIARHTLELEFRKIDPSAARIILVEAADRILGMYHPKLSARAQTSLERLGVEVRCRTRVVSVEEGMLTLGTDGAEDEYLPATTILWAAGVEASPLAKLLGQQVDSPIDRAGRVAVKSDLSLEGRPEVFVIGDMADCRGTDGHSLPGIAPVAMQQGKYVAKTIRKELHQARSKPESSRVPFAYHHKGSLATIGRSAAVADIGGWKLSGFIAWMLWLVIHIANLSQFESRILVFVQWIWSFVTFGRSARLITGEPDSTAPPTADRKHR